MLDLQPIKARLRLSTPGPWTLDVTYFQPKSIWARVGKLFSADDATYADCALIANAPADLTALVAEVERLRGAIEAHRGTYVADRSGEDEASWSALDEADRKLWEALDA